MPPRRRPQRPRAWSRRRQRPSKRSIRRTPSSPTSRIHRTTEPSPDRQHHLADVIVALQRDVSGRRNEAHGRPFGVRRAMVGLPWSLPGSLAMAFDLDDLDPRQKKSQPKNLDVMNIEDLREYAAVLKAELARVEDKMKAKQSHAAAAASLFKK